MMQNTIRQWLNRPFRKAEKPDFTALLSKLETRTMEKSMSAEVLGPTVNRAIGAYKRLQEAHAGAVAKIMDQDKRIKTDAEIIAGYKVIMDEIWPEDVGGSVGSNLEPN